MTTARLDPVHESVSSRLGTRWGRACVMALLATGVVLALAGLMRSQVLATSFVVQGTTADFATSQVTGTDVAFAMTTISSKSAAGAVTSRPVYSAGFATGQLDGLCLSQAQSLGPLGTFTLRIEAGDGVAGTTEISASNMQFDLTRLRGTGSGIKLDGMVQLGLASSDVTTTPGTANPLGAPAGTGYWGIDATAGNIANVRGTLYDAQIIGNASLPNLTITLTPGTGSSCANSPLPK